MRVRFLLACCIFSLLASCAGPDNGLRRIEHPDQPLERRGVVVYPPAEGAWSLGEQEVEAETGLFFLKDFGVPAPSGKIGPSTFITVFIASTPPADFSKRYPTQHAALEAFALAAAKPSAGRFKDQSCETAWGELQGQEFVRVSRSSEERDNPNDPSAVLQLDERTTWLFHPHQPATVVRVVVSHRRPVGGESPSLVELEQSFLAKLAFR